jgi:hypothetical protein
MSPLKTHEHDNAVMFSLQGFILLCRKCGAEDETSAHILCRCEALASIRHAHLGSFLEPEDIKCITLGAIWRFAKAAGLL